MIFGEESKLSFYYRKLAGNVPDVKTIQKLLQQLDVLRYEKVKLVTDRGYYSAENIKSLFNNHPKFPYGKSFALSFAKGFIREIESRKDYYEYYNSNLGLYVFTRTIAWDYEQEHLYRSAMVKKERSMYLHLYFNPDKFSDDGNAFSRKQDILKNELLSGHRGSEHEKDYRKYFEIKEIPRRMLSLTVKQDTVDAVHERYGFFVLISNESRIWPQH